MKRVQYRLEFFVVLLEFREDIVEVLDRLLLKAPGKFHLGICDTFVVLGSEKPGLEGNQRIAIEVLEFRCLLECNAAVYGHLAGRWSRLEPSTARPMIGSRMSASMLLQYWSTGANFKTVNHKLV